MEPSTVHLVGFGLKAKREFGKDFLGRRGAESHESGAYTSEQVIRLVRRGK